MTPIYDENILSDLHKDAYGFRPGESFWARWKADSVAERNATWNGLLRSLDSAIADEKAATAAAIVDFEDAISRNLKLGAADRATAIRWHVEANINPKDLEWDLAYALGAIVFDLGIWGTSQAKELKEVIS